MTPPRLVLYTAPGCSLCEPAREVVAAVAAPLGVAVVEVDISADPALERRYRTQIPVVEVDGRRTCTFYVEPDELRAALLVRAPG